MVRTSKLHLWYNPEGVQTTLHIDTKWLFRNTHLARVEGMFNDIIRVDLPPG